MGASWIGSAEVVEIVSALECKGVPMNVMLEEVDLL